LATYVIGDLQGCHIELLALLAKIDFNAAHDRLWFVGDLVNRGPSSLAVLRTVRGLGKAATTVLGNHDLHLLATAVGARREHRKDTFGEVLAAPDRDDWIEWLRHLPLLHHDPGLALTMVHAGIPPPWDLTQCAAHAVEVEQALRGPAFREFLRRMYGNRPRRWSPRLSAAARLRYTVNALTRMRYCDRSGALDFEQAGPPGSQPERLLPWYAVPGRASLGQRIVFGHWATLQLDAPLDPSHGVLHVDTGCVWGGPLTALRIEDLHRFQVPGPNSSSGDDGVARSKSRKS